MALAEFISAEFTRRERKSLLSVATCVELRLKQMDIWRPDKKVGDEKPALMYLNVLCEEAILLSTCVGCDT